MELYLLALCSLNMHHDSGDTRTRRGKMTEGTAQGGEGGMEVHGACLVGANVSV